MTRSKYLLIVNIAIIGTVISATVNLTSPSTPTDIALFNNKVYISTFGGGIVELNKNLKYIRTITSADGLGVNLIQSLQASGDKLWYGTIEGLGYIDQQGKSAYIYSPGNCRLVDVNDICECKDDIWFATEEGALAYNKLLDAWNLHFSEEGAILNDLYSVATIDDRVYFGGVDRIFWYDYTENKWGHKDLSDKYSGIYVNDITELYGKLLIATTNGLYEYIPFEDRLIYPLLNLKDEVGTIYQTGKEIVFGSKLEIVKLDTESGKYEIVKLSGDIRKDEVIKGILEIGSKLVCITGNGAYTLVGNKVVKIDLESALLGPAVYDIENFQNIIYVATTNGVMRFDNGKVDNLFQTKEQDPPQCIGFLGDKTMVGTRSGLYIPEKKVTKYIKMPPVNHIMKYKDKTYVATDGGMYIINISGNIDKSFDVSSGLPNNRISDLLIYKDKIYVSTLGGGLAIIDPENYQVIEKPEVFKNIDSNYIFSLLTYGNYLFIGSWDRGLFIYDGTDVKNITWGDGLRHTDIWAMDLYYPYLFLSVRACGIDIYDIEKNAVVGYISSSDGLGSDYIRSIRVVDNKVWFGSAGGLAIADISDIISLLKVAN